MAGQGCSTLPTADDGRILDRLAGLEKVIPPELIQQALIDTNCVNGRACKVTHELMMWVLLAMGLYTDVPIKQVFKNSRRMQSGERTPGRSTLCEAKQRLGVEPVRRLFELVVCPLATVAQPN
jgi:hypothetical protein